MFDDAAMAEISSMLRISDQQTVQALQNDLATICAHYQEIIATLPCDLPGAPLNMSLTKRGDWLEANVINPAEKLITALAEGKRPMFSTWPYPLTPPKFRDNSALLSELNSLITETVQLRDSLRSQQADDAGHSQELRAEIFVSIVEALRKHPIGVPASRGVYDAEFRQRRGGYVDAVRFIFKQITGVEENLDRLIGQEIRFKL